MINNYTWVKLYRKLNNSAFKRKPLTVALFIHLLLSVNSETKKTIWNDEEITVLPGQIITGRKTLSEDTGITQQSIRTSLQILKSTRTLTIKTYTKFSIITINNWNEYQQSTRSSTNKQPTTNQQLTTTKEYKNIRIKDKEIYKEKDFGSIEKITPEVVNYIANYYHVKESFVEKQRQQLELYCQSNGKSYKDYKATLMMWVNRKLDDTPKTERLKDLEPKHVEDLRLHPERLYVYQNLGYDVSRIGGLCK